MNALHQIVARCEASEISTAVALMELLMTSRSAEVVGEFLAALAQRSPTVDALQTLFADHEPGCRRIAAMLQADVDRPPVAGTIEEGVAFCRTLFDWSVQQSETASVALYSLGSSELLAAATREIVELLRSYELLSPTQRVLDLGCGTGRMEVALAGEVGTIHGIDVSAEMVLVAGRRTAELSNVTIALSSGLDLAGVADGSFDLVLAVDSFPYVVQAGWALAARMFEEAARVLGPSGELVILHFSYRGDPTRDREDAKRLAEQHGFELLVNGAFPFRLWNGDAYRMRLCGAPSGDRPALPVSRGSSH